MRRYQAIIAFVFAAGVFGMYFWAWSGGKLGFDPNAVDSTSDSVFRTCMALVGMLAGIVFGGLHRLWRERKEPMSLGVLKVSFYDAEMWRSILVAPLVFSGVYIAAKAQPDTVLSFFFAFQSGFFSDAILQGKSKNVEKMAE